jgi:hypothetical protein
MVPRLVLLSARALVLVNPVITEITLACPCKRATVRALLATIARRALLLPHKWFAALEITAVFIHLRLLLAPKEHTDLPRLYQQLPARACALLDNSGPPPVNQHPLALVSAALVIIALQAALTLQRSSAARAISVLLAHLPPPHALLVHLPTQARKPRVSSVLWDTIAHKAALAQHSTLAHQARMAPCKGLLHRHALAIVLLVHTAKTQPKHQARAMVSALLATMVVPLDSHNQTARRRVLLGTIALLEVLRPLRINADLETTVQQKARRLCRALRERTVPLQL